MQLNAQSQQRHTAYAYYLFVLGVSGYGIRRMPTTFCVSLVLYVVYYPIHDPSIYQPTSFFSGRGYYRTMEVCLSRRHDSHNQ